METLCASQVLLRCVRELHSNELTSQSFANLMWVFATVQLGCLQESFVDNVDALKQFYFHSTDRPNPSASFLERCDPSNSGSGPRQG